MELAKPGLRIDKNTPLPHCPSPSCAEKVNFLASSGPIFGRQVKVAIRLSEEDMHRLDALADRIPIASRNAIARAALRFGLAALEADPAKLRLARVTVARRAPDSPHQGVFAEASQYAPRTRREEVESSFEPQG
jgi:hypothetical protein